MAPNPWRRAPAPPPKARAAAAAEAACHLLDLSHDEQSIVTHELCDPLRPLLAVHPVSYTHLTLPTTPYV